MPFAVGIRWFVPKKRPTPMADSTNTFLKVSRLCKNYGQIGGSEIRAVNNVSFSLFKGEVLGLVGESGCGKSTLGRALLRLTEPTSGQVHLEGRSLTDLSQSALKAARRDIQIIFQDPFGSLNPRHRVSTLLSEPLKVHKVGDASSQKLRVNELLDMVGLPADSARRYPHEFSGGQRQRIAIARALALNPKFLVADEAVSALDVSIQSQIINLIIHLQKQLGITMLFISHDLSVIRHVSDRIAVMYLGEIVEIGLNDAVLNAPQHPYTKALISAVPNPARANEQRILLKGEIPDPANPPLGCSFNTRCPSMTASVQKLCLAESPELCLRKGDDLSSRHVACHLLERV